MMNRRAFIGTLAGGLLTAPLAAEAQQSGKVFRIGILANVWATDPRGEPLWQAFIQGLRELGYVEGQNITIEHRSSEGRYERLPALAAELVRLKVDVIVVPASQNALAAKEATRTIPIVMASAADPVAEGIVASLARPGGNITGLMGNAGPEIAGKRLELLKEAVPKVSRVAILRNPTNAANVAGFKESEVVAQALRIQLLPLDVRRADDFASAFPAALRARVDALIVIADAVLLTHRARIADFAAKNRLPAMYGGQDYMDAGGLMFYGANNADVYRRAATYVDKILKGAKPADLPVEQASKYELVINLKTAKELGLDLPTSVLARADEVIE